jgi:DNA-binding CsgD family transcriptional regulator
VPSGSGWVGGVSGLLAGLVLLTVGLPYEPAANSTIWVLIAFTDVALALFGLTRLAEVLRRYAQGADPREIAADMYLSYGTVRNYLASAMTKLDARTRVDAMRKATEAGWL